MSEILTNENAENAEREGVIVCLICPLVRSFILLGKAAC